MVVLLLQLLVAVAVEVLTERQAALKRRTGERRQDGTTIFNYGGRNCKERLQGYSQGLNLRMISNKFTTLVFFY